MVGDDGAALRKSTYLKIRDSPRWEKPECVLSKERTETVKNSTQILIAAILLLLPSALTGAESNSVTITNRVPGLLREIGGVPTDPRKSPWETLQLECNQIGVGEIRARKFRWELQQDEAEIKRRRALAHANGQDTGVFL